MYDDATLSRIYFLKVRSEEHTSELQSLSRISYAVFCLKNLRQFIHGMALIVLKGHRLFVKGYENAPEKCPQCGVPASKFKEQEADKMAWACEHEVGVAQGSPEDIMMDLRANFESIRPLSEKRISAFSPQICSSSNKR